MERLTEFGRSCVVSAEWLAAMGLAFAVLVSLMPCNRGVYCWKDLRGFATDLVYWFCMPLIFRNGRTLMLWAGALVCLAAKSRSFYR